MTQIRTGQIKDFAEAVQDAVAALLVAGSNVTLTYDDASGTLTIAATGGSSSGQYRQFLYTVVSGNPTFLTDSDGNILTVALDLE